MKLLDKIINLDRRIIFVFIALSVIIPLLFKLTFPEFPTKMTKDMFELIDKLPPNSKVLIAMDYDPPSEPEIGPMAISVMRHAMMNNLKIYFITLWPTGQQMIANLIENLLKTEFPDKKYGTDFVNLGYKAGRQGVIPVIATNLEKLYPTDVNNVSIRNIPMTQGVKNLSDFDIVVGMSAGWPGIKEWIQFGTDPLDIPFVAGTTAIQTTLYLPYYPKQLNGLLGGIKGAAEYESLIAKKFERFADPKLHIGILRWGPQTIAHIVIVIFILIGNITYFIDRKRKTLV
ncbi:MAG: hypothetical protein ABIE74_08365 [Pseudomonadota bacterium]